MTGRLLLAALIACVAAALPAASARQSAAGATAAQANPNERFWHQWRGPYATGVSRTANPPLEWSETKNVRWKVELPGRGSASPVVWNDRVFVLSAVPVGVTGAAAHEPRGGLRPRDRYRYVVLAIDRRTGKTLWEQTTREELPHEAAHGENGTYASSSAITDGQRVYAWFESQGMFVYDMDGKQLWHKDLGDKKMRNQFGEGSTPVLYRDRLFIVWDHQGQSFIVALDARTGEEVWRANREEIDTWATPLVVEHGGRAQVIAPAMRKVRSYDVDNGQIVWEGPGLTMNPIPSPVAADGMVFLMSGFQGNRLRAIRLADAKGDLSASNAAEAWTLDRDTPYVPSPLLYDGILYFLKTNSGILSAFDAKSGTPHYQLQRLDGVPNVFASPVGAQGRVYLPGREGVTLVIKHGPAFEVLAKNKLDDGFDASPALVDNEIYLRSYQFLYSIAEK